MSDNVDWSQFPITIGFDVLNTLGPVQSRVVGKLVAVEAVPAASGTVVPKLSLQLDDGTLATVIASQARLRRALHEACPKLGERIQINYHGPAPHAAPGMKPAKNFTVRVDRREGKP